LLLDRLRDFERKYVKRDPIELLATVPPDMRDEVRRIAPVVAGWLKRLGEMDGFDNIIKPAADVGQLVGNEQEPGRGNCSPDGRQAGTANTTTVCPVLAASDPQHAVGALPDQRTPRKRP
jgi:hypothetical protein